MKLLIFTVLVFCVSIFLFLVGMTYLSFFRDINSKDILMNKQTGGITLLDDSGKEFFVFNKSSNNEIIPLSDIPKDMQNAAIASEDKDFYNNPGISFNGIFRAFLIDTTSGKVTQGGSTITQQLVKNALLSPKKSFARKFQEIILAFAITKKYKKQEILEMYLNSVYFGEGAFGVENAANAYFDIHAKDLDLAQSALLAGLIPAPSAYSPLSNNPNIAKNKQRQILHDMQGLGFITSSQEKEAEAEPLIYSKKPATTNLLAPHFALMVRDSLYQKYGEEYVLRSSLTVKTTLHRQWQEYAESVVKDQVLRLGKDGVSNGAAVVIDPLTGQIKALVGSYDWFDTEFGKVNMAITPRQSGSAFKPIIYSEALTSRLITPATILSDTPTVFPGNYKPKDYDGRYRGPVTVRRALANSLNIPSVEVMQKVGVEEGLSMAQNLGITTLTDPSQFGLSLVLGAGPVSLLQLTNAYAVFSDNGIYHAPTSILEVRDKYNSVIDSYQDNPQEVLDDGTAFLISSILSDSKTRHEEFGNALDTPFPAAVKTGTTEDFKDALTIGYTPSLVIGVWVGNNDNRPMDNIAGSLGAAPIWKSLMTEFLPQTHTASFTQPSSITKTLACPVDNGHLVTAPYQEYFLEGTEPLNCPYAYTPTIDLTPSISPGQTITPPTNIPSQQIFYFNAPTVTP